MRIKFLVAITALVILQGCGNARIVRAEVAERSKDAADQVLESAEWVRCEAASIGAVRREYNSPERFQAYLDSCPAW